MDDNRDFIEEKQHLAHLQAWLDQAIRDGEKTWLDLTLQEEAVKSHAWDDRLEMKDSANVADNAVVQQSLRQLFGEKERLKQQLEVYRRLKEKPYFGKISFAFAGEAAEDYYIGFHALYDPEACESLVLDWRSPLASLYYEGDLGEAEVAAPSGLLRGHLYRKQMLVIHRGELRLVADYDREMADEVLREMLSHASSEKMQDIVATIQKQQNQVIKKPLGESFLLLGAAGSGKSSVALHRAAWILYRERFASGRILFISPSHIFSEYIQDVLPSLGEENLSIYSLADWQKNLVSPQAPRLENFDFAEASPERRQAAGSFDFVPLLEAFWQEHAEDHELNLLRLYGEFLESERLQTYLPELAKPLSGRHYDRVDLSLLAFLSQLIKPSQTQNYYYCMLIDEAQDLLPIEHLTLREAYTCPTNLYADFNQAIRFPLPEGYQEFLQKTYAISDASVYRFAKSYRSTQEIMQLAHSLLPEQELEPFSRHGEPVRLKPLTDSAELLVEIPHQLAHFYQHGHRRLALICRDDEEARQLLYAFLEISGYFLEPAHMPGDWRPLWAKASAEERKAFSQKLSAAEAQQEGRRSYSFERFPWPQLVTSDDQGHVQVYILTAAACKGLEFDAVLLTNASREKYHATNDRKLLYVAVTRALHELAICYQGELTPFLSQAIPKE